MSFLTKLFNKKIRSDNQVVEVEEKITISFDHRSLKVLATDQKGENIFWVEEKFFGGYAGGKDGDKIKNITPFFVKALSDLQHRIEGKNVLCSLPLEGVFIESITLPKTTEEEKLVLAEVKQKIPIPFKEILFAFNKVFSSASASNYFCIAMQKYIFEEYTEHFKNFGAKASFELCFFSDVRLLSKQSTDFYQTLVVVDLDDAYIILSNKGVVVDLVHIANNFSTLKESLASKFEVNQEVVTNFISNIQKLKEKNKESYYLFLESEKNWSNLLAKEILDSVIHLEQKFALNVQEINYLTSIENFSFDQVIQSLESIQKKNMEKDIFKNTILPLEEKYKRYAHNLGIAKRVG